MVARFFGLIFFFILLVLGIAILVWYFLRKKAMVTMGKIEKKLIDDEIDANEEIIDLYDKDDKTKRK